MNAILAFLRDLLRYVRPVQSGLKEGFRPDGITSWAEIDGHAKPPYDEGPVDIEAVIGYGSVSGWRAPGFDVQAFDLCAWRRPNEPLREDKLLLLVPLPEGRLASIDFPLLSIWRMRVVLSKARDRAILIAWEPAPGDAASEAVIRRLREPAVVQDDLLGELTLDRDVNWFDGEATWNGNVVRVTVTPTDDGSLESGRATAAELWADEASWARRIEGFAVGELLDNANGWLEIGTASHTREGFLSRLKLNSISLLPDGQFEFWYDDGDLFWGHSICVRGDVANGPHDASIEG